MSSQTGLNLEAIKARQQKTWASGDFAIIGYNPRQARGWTSLILVLLFSAAVQLFCLGILGEYMGRLFEETKRRPIYLVKKRIGVEPPALDDIG